IDTRGLSQMDRRGNADALHGSRLERAFERSVGAHVHDVTRAFHLDMFVVAQIEGGEADLRCRTPARDTKVALGPVFHHVSGGYQVEIPGIAEFDIVPG